MNETIHAVYGTNVDREYFLGLAIGERCDIEAYFEARQGYGLAIEVVTPVTIPTGYAAESTRLKLKRADVQGQLDKLDAQIENRGTPE